jgi:SPP1 gp7 family putative phage head morphogenesis protein
VTSGWSVSSLAQEILAMDSKISQGRANFIARDQIGKLNGHISQRRMESAGLSMYEWMTSGDERVRESHRIMDGLLCRWDDPTVYSDDGGKTWKDRPSGAVLLHPGDDFQCRCTSLAYWQEIVGEVDEQIDLLGGSVDNIPDSGQRG